MNSNENLILVIEPEEEVRPLTQAEKADNFRRLLHCNIREKYNVLQMQKTLCLPLMVNALDDYDYFLNDEVKNLIKRCGVNFKFMVRETLPIESQLSYWIITEERKPSEKYPEKKSFVVFISRKMWASLQQTSYGAAPRKYFWESCSSTNDDSFGCFLLLLEYYISVFVTVMYNGHSSLTTEENFIREMQRNYQVRFGDNKNNIWRTPNRFLFNQETKKVGVFEFGEDDKAIVWQNDTFDTWNFENVVHVRTDFWQSNSTSTTQK